MKVLSFNPERCIGCGICEDVCSETWFKVTDREKSRIRISEGENGSFSALYCVQAGDCIDVCPVEALSRNKQGIVLVKNKVCVGCLSCVGFCPYGAMFYHPDQTQVFKCVACGKCADACPENALEIVEIDTPRAPGLQV
ncbi:MAG: 4Fe-4S binding protein [Anaerolineae bacterium]|nr:4Fe-4S binding protein [Anaerolineae bacterium]